MKSIKMALLGGAALAVSAAAAQADDLDALKAQIEALNARVAAMEAAPSVPAGYSLLTIAEVDRVNTPGLDLTSRQAANYGSKATMISVLPTADAPAGANIVWSGYARAALRYRNIDVSADYKFFNDEPALTEDWAWESADVADGSRDDWDVPARGQLRVQANTDTAVGEVGVDIRLRADYDGISGNGSSVYADVAWGYWAMTPELTFGGGFAGSLGNIGYGQDGATISNYTDTVAFNPGDTSQLRLSYGSGPFSMAVAVEDASTGALDVAFFGTPGDDIWNGFTYDALGVAGELKYSGDMFSGEISGVWRDISNFDDDGDGYIADQFLPDSWWQIGAGLQFGLGDLGFLSFAAAMGEGPATDFGTNNVVPVNNSGIDLGDTIVPWNNTWWGASALAHFDLADEFVAEASVGYISRDFDEVDLWDDADADSLTADSSRWVVAGGLYYNPVEQLTIGIEGSYSMTSFNIDNDVYGDGAGPYDEELDVDVNTTTIDFVSVWRF